MSPPARFTANDGVRCPSSRRSVTDTSGDSDAMSRSSVVMSAEVALSSTDAVISIGRSIFSR